MEYEIAEEGSCLEFQPIDTVSPSTFLPLNAALMSPEPERHDATHFMALLRSTLPFLPSSHFLSAAAVVETAFLRGIQSDSTYCKHCSSPTAVQTGRKKCDH